MDKHMTDLAQQTPKEIDTALAAINERLFDALAALDRADMHVKYEAERRAKAVEPMAASLLRDMERAEAVVAKYRAEVDALTAEAAPYDEQYRLRGWRRYFLVTNQGGHVHRERNCSTCFPRTRYAWLPALSGCDEAAMVAEYGEQACTVCFPGAPSLYQQMKAAGLTRPSPQASARAEAKAAREAKRAAAAAKKAAAAIANPDGSPLVDGNGWRVETIHRAKQVLVDSIGSALMCEGRPDRNQEYGAACRAAFERVAAAIAHKTGEPVEAVKAAAEAKARKRGY